MSTAASYLDVDEPEEGSVLKRRPLPVDGEMDITPMIDCTFLLLIFFIVSSIQDPTQALALPTAVSGVAVPKAESIFITIEAAGPRGSQIFLADGKVGEPLSGEWKGQEDQIRSYVEEGMANGLKYVVFKAEGGLPMTEVNRVALALSPIEGVRLHWAAKEEQP